MREILPTIVPVNRPSTVAANDKPRFSETECSGAPASLNMSASGIRSFTLRDNWSSHQTKTRCVFPASTATGSYRRAGRAGPGTLLTQAPQASTNLDLAQIVQRRIPPKLVEIRQWSDVAHDSDRTRQTSAHYRTTLPQLHTSDQGLPQEVPRERQSQPTSQRSITELPLRRRQVHVSA